MHLSVDYLEGREEWSALERGMYLSRRSRARSDAIVHRDRTMKRCVVKTCYENTP